MLSKRPDIARMNSRPVGLVTAELPTQESLCGSNIMLDGRWSDTAMRSEKIRIPVNP